MEAFSFFVLLKFILASLLAFSIPGYVVLKRLKLKTPESLVIGTIMGIALWSLAGFAFGLLTARWLFYPYIISFLLLFLKSNWINLRNIRSKTLFKINFFDLLLVSLGLIISLSGVWFMGVYIESGLFFCCRGVPDAIYHLTLTRELMYNFPPYEPGMPGVSVKNYHYLSNLAVADFARVFDFEIISLQFRYINLLIAILMSLSVFVFSSLMNLGKSYARMLYIFLFGAGDLIYFLLFVRGKGLNFDVTVIDDASKLLAGPPRAFSILVLLGAMCLMGIWFKKKNLYAGILSAIMIGALIGFKTYTGIFALSGLFFVSSAFFFNRHIRMIIPSLIATFLSAFYFLIVNKNAGGLVFSGFWRFENFVLHKQLSLEKLEFLRLEAFQNGNLFQVAIFEILFIFIFFIVLFGTLNLAFLQSKSSLRLLPKEFNIFLVSSLLTSLVLGSLFVQKTGGANAIQFFITASLMASFYAALVVYTRLLKSPKAFSLFLTAILILITVGRVVHEGIQNFQFIKNRSGLLLSSSELNALNFLRSTPIDSLIVVDPWMSDDQPFLYTTLVAQRSFYLLAANLLRDHGQDPSSRVKDVDLIFRSSNLMEVETVLRSNSIDYVFVSKGIDLPSKDSSHLKKVFDNERATIFQVI